MRQRVTCKKALSIRTTEGFALLFLSADFLRLMAAELLERKK